MEIQQAVNIIKQTIDEALKSGTIKSLEQCSAIIQSWSLIVKELNEKQNK
jgi:hypothetical protein